MKMAICKKTIMGLILSMLLSFSVQADEGSEIWVETKQNNDSILLPVDQRESVDRQYNYTRGNIISSAMSSVANEGGGTIEVMLETLAHHQCDKILHIAYLERWVAEDQDYEQVARYEFVEYAEDHPNESFTGLTSRILVDDQPSGYYYRVRGTHKVWAGETSEGFTTRTNGVMIKKEP